jgi:[calcium/calmodulin-dependent protein kinase] kinase
MDCNAKHSKDRFGSMIRELNEIVKAVMDEQRGNRTVAPEAKRVALVALHEIAIMKKLDHQNIVRLHEVIYDDKEQEVHLVMDYIDKGSVGIVQPDGTCASKIAVSQLPAFLYQTMTGLRYLHRKGVFHRDIKPENILFSSEGVFYLADFGVSSVLFQGTSVDFGGGTQVLYSPERCNADGKVPQAELAKLRAASDVWALGAVLYALRFGRAPFFSTNPEELSRQIREDPLTCPDDCPLDDPIRPVLCQMLDKDPTKRITLSELRKLDYVEQGKRPNEIEADEEDGDPTPFAPEPPVATVLDGGVLDPTTLSRIFRVSSRHLIFGIPIPMARGDSPVNT